MASTSVVLPWSTWAMMATFLRFGFAITIRTVYRTSYSTSASGCGARPSPGSGRASPRALALKVSKGELSQARQQIARAGAELLVVGDLLGVGPRVSGTGEVVVRHCRVEPRGRHPAAAGCDGLLALGDLARLARGRVVAATDLVEFGEHVRLGVLQAARGARDDLDRARPLLPFGQHQAVVVARFAVAVVAFQGFVEFGARDFERLSKVRDDAGQLRHLGVDEQFGGELDVGPGLVVALETRFIDRPPVAAVADMPPLGEKLVHGGNGVLVASEERQGANLPEERVHGLGFVRQRLAVHGEGALEFLGRHRHVGNRQRQRGPRWMPLIRAIER